MSKEPQLISDHAGLPDDVRFALDALARITERYSHDFRASVLLLSEDGSRLLDCAGPSLPIDYRNAIHNSEIGEGQGSCGTAAFLNERVIVSEFVHGLGFEDLKALPQAERDRIGEMIFRFYFGCMYRHRQFSGDPHPGNFLLQPDGKVAFLDFGLFKVMPEELIKIELACQRAGHEGDGERLKQIFTETGFLGQPERFRPDKLLAQFLDATWWYVLDEEVHLQPEIATEVMIEMSDPRSSHFGQMRHETLPADHLFGRRVELLTLAVLSQLEAKANWHRIAREWMYGDPPVTELGREEAAFWAGR